VDESIGGLARPSKFPFEPRQPLSVFKMMIPAIDQPTADLDHVGDDALAKVPDYFGVLGEGGMGLTGLRRKGGFVIGR
jgi:hypothetical protein